MREILRERLVGWGGVGEQGRAMLKNGVGAGHQGLSGRGRARIPRAAKFNTEGDMQPLQVLEQGGSSRKGGGGLQHPPKLGGGGVDGIFLDIHPCHGAGTLIRRGEHVPQHL